MCTLQQKFIWQKITHFFLKKTASELQKNVAREGSHIKKDFFNFFTKTNLFGIQVQFHKFKLPRALEPFFFPEKERFNLKHLICFRVFKSDKHVKTGIVYI